MNDKGHGGVFVDHSFKMKFKNMCCDKIMQVKHVMLNKVK